MLTAGSRVPETVLHQLVDGAHQTTTLIELSTGKRIAVFAVPGAFTPTCSQSHLPMFLTRAYDFKRRGIDRIVCISTADIYVMDAWGRSKFVGDRITMLSDGDGEFCRMADMTLDLSGHGFGIRSKRYAMVVSDGIVETILVESDPMKATESSADALLKAITSRR